LLDGGWHGLRALDARVNELNQEIAIMAMSEPAAVRLQQLRGVGPMVATALLWGIPARLPTDDSLLPRWD
jgi:transposase